jgi:quercetin dioxygenase-like cupin family protein
VRKRSLFRRNKRNGVAMSTLRILATALVLAFGSQPIQSARAAESAVVTPLMLKELADIPGKEMLMITVDYPPGAVDPVHRHDARAFVYVLQGSIVMQVRGGEEVTLVPGQTFYEGPNDVHTVGRNASTTEPAKFIVILLKRSRRGVAGRVVRPSQRPRDAFAGAAARPVSANLQAGAGMDVHCHATIASPSRR